MRACLRALLQVRHLPKEMAERGTVSLTRTQVAQLMGEVFIQKSAVNLLSTVLGTPEFFWRAPDSLQVGGEGRGWGGMRCRGRTLHWGRWAGAPACRAHHGSALYSDACTAGSAGRGGADPWSAWCMYSERLWSLLPSFL